MNTRIKELRKALNKSQEDFGKILGLSKSGISEIEAGRRNVTEQHIIMLKNCSDFNVNEVWLRTGEGDMFLPIEREKDIARLTMQLLTEESDSFKNRLVSALARLSEDEWEVIERMFASVVDTKKE